MTKAEELKEISKKTREKTAADRQYEAMVDQCTTVAETTGETEFRWQKMTRKFFEDSKERFTVPADRTVDEVIDEMYGNQELLLKKLQMEGGFTVVEIAPEFPSTLDINMDEHTRIQVEHAKRYLEADVVISWG